MVGDFYNRLIGLIMACPSFASLLSSLLERQIRGAPRARQNPEFLSLMIAAVEVEISLSLHI